MTATLIRKQVKLNQKNFLLSSFPREIHLSAILLKVSHLHDHLSLLYFRNGHAIDRSRPTIIDKSNRTRRWQAASLWPRGEIEQINRLYLCRGYYTLDN